MLNRVSATRPRAGLRRNAPGFSWARAGPLVSTTPPSVAPGCGAPKRLAAGIPQKARKRRRRRRRRPASQPAEYALMSGKEPAVICRERRARNRKTPPAQPAHPASPPEERRRGQTRKQQGAGGKGPREGKGASVAESRASPKVEAAGDLLYVQAPPPSHLSGSRLQAGRRCGGGGGSKGARRSGNLGRAYHFKSITARRATRIAAGRAQRRGMRRARVQGQAAWGVDCAAVRASGERAGSGAGDPPCSSLPAADFNLSWQTSAPVGGSRVLYAEPSSSRKPPEQAGRTSRAAPGARTFQTKDRSAARLVLSTLRLLHSVER